MVACDAQGTGSQHMVVGLLALAKASLCQSTVGRSAKTRCDNPRVSGNLHE